MKPKLHIVVQKRQDQPKVQPTVDRPDLEALHTKQLLNRLQAHRSGWPEIDVVELAAIKAVLATREHVPNKDEAKELRKQRQQYKQCRR